MTSDKDDLEEALQENLRLRRQLGAEASKGTATIRAGGMGYRLGWVLYWAACIVAGLLALIGLFYAFIAPESHWLGALILGFVVWLIGRTLRYVFSGS